MEPTQPAKQNHLEIIFPVQYDEITNQVRQNWRYKLTSHKDAELLLFLIEWRGGVMVSRWTRKLKVRGFNSRQFCLQVTTFGKMFTHMCLCHQAVNLVPVEGWWCPAAGKVTAGLTSHRPRVTLHWFIQLRAHGLRKGDDGLAHFAFYLIVYAYSRCVKFYDSLLQYWYSWSWVNDHHIDHFSTRN